MTPKSAQTVQIRLVYKHVTVVFFDVGGSSRKNSLNQLRDWARLETGGARTRRGSSEHRSVEHRSVEHRSCEHERSMPELGLASRETVAGETGAGESGARSDRQPIRRGSRNCRIRAPVGTLSSHFRHSSKHNCIQEHSVIRSAHKLTAAVKHPLGWVWRRLFRWAPVRVARMLLLVLGLTAALMPQIGHAGCGDYVFDRLHPQILHFPGISLYRLPYRPTNAFHNPEYQQPDISSSVQMLKQVSWNALPGQYSTEPSPCHGPHCRQVPQAPIGQMAATLPSTDHGPNMLLANLSSSILDEDFEETDYPAYQAPIVSPWNDQIYRPPG